MDTRKYTKNMLLVLTTLTVGLTAGLLFGYQVSVIPAFRELSDTAYITAFQAINRAILNPAFLLVFLGAGGFLVAVTYQERRSMRFRYLLVALSLYAIGVLGVTFAGNVPRNDALAAFPTQTATLAEQHTARTNFEGPWNDLHIIRAVAATVSLALVGYASLQHSSKTTSKNI